MTPCTAPIDTRASTSAATSAGGAPPSTGTSRSSRPSTPPRWLTSSTASWAQSSQLGPNMPAGPRIGYTSAMLTTPRSTVSQDAPAVMLSPPLDARTPVPART